jgi:carbamoyl-phosphate synthase large subunit
VGEGIIKCLKLANSKNEKNYTYEIISVDMSPLAPGLYRGISGKLVPSADSPSYVDSLLRICKTNSVKAIFVGSDEELMVLSRRSKEIEEESGAKVIGNSPKVLEIAKDKWKTYQFLKRENIPCPESDLPENAEEFIERVGFPIVVKPREGHGSIHFHIVSDAEELQYAISRIKKSNLEPMLQEFLKGEDSEFTTGVILDRTGKSVQSSIAMRRVLKHGQTYKAFIEDYPKVREVAERAALRLLAGGPINAQSRIVGGVSKIFEINPRFSASCPIRAIAGVNEPDLVFRNQVLGEKLSIPKIEMNLVALRYWNEVYVPYRSFNKLSELGESTRPESFIPDYF